MGGDRPLYPAAEALPSVSGTAALKQGAESHDVQGNPLMERAFMAERMRFGYVQG
jgi:hypothetical protein